jgi:hypothetical protein
LRRCRDLHRNLEQPQIQRQTRTQYTQINTS